MLQNFDIFGQAELPELILCNPNKVELCSLNKAYEVKLAYAYNALSELSFSLPETINDIPVEAYPLTTSKRLVLIENFGYFLITNIDESKSGGSGIKRVTAQSLEVELNYKKAAFSGTMQFYDPIEPENSVLGKIMKYIPTWNIGVIEGALAAKSRTFDVKDTTIYNFLMTTCETAFECIFYFDSYEKTINAKLRESAVKNTDIYLSFDNLIKEANLKTISDEIATALYVYGSGDLDVRTVNPLGGTAIYDFSYYMNTDWMSQALIDRLTFWKNETARLQPTYADYLAQFREQNSILLLLQSCPDTTNSYYPGLAELQAEYDKQEGIMKVRIEGKKPDTEIAPIATYLKQLSDLINKKKIAIDSQTNVVIKGIQDNLKSISDYLKIENFFITKDNNGAIIDDSLYKELSVFIIENTYQNEHFLQTDLMTPVEIQDMAQELYDQAKEVIARVSLPRFEFELDTANFVYLEEYKPFTDQLELGTVATVDMGNYTVETYLLQIEMSFDNPDDFKLTFSNRMRLDNGNFKFADLFDQAVKIGTKTGFDASSWSNFNNNYRDSVSDFINNALDAATKNIINNSDHTEISITGNGLRGKRFDTTSNKYLDQEVWLTSNMLAFTDNAWQNTKLAIGSVANGSYGVVGDVIVGRILAGNKLEISNVNSKDGKTVNFKLDGNGAVLNNADFTILNSNNTSKITLSPTVGITIEKAVGTGWTKQLSIDTNGNAVFAGQLSAASGSFTGSIAANAGSIGGFTINTSGLYKDDSHYLYSNGNLKWGALEIIGTTAKFTGDIIANSFTGKINNSNIDNNTISGQKFTSDSFSGKNYNGSVGWGTGNGYLKLTGTGAVELNAGGTLELVGGGNARITLQSGFVGTNCNITIETGHNLTLNNGAINAYGAYSSSVGGDFTIWGTLDLKGSGSTIRGDCSFLGSNTYISKLSLGSTLSANTSGSHSGSVSTSIGGWSCSGTHSGTIYFSTTTYPNKSITVTNGLVTAYNLN